MKKENSNYLKENFSFDCYKNIKHARTVLYNYLSNPNITVRKLAEEADISFSTLNNLLYGNSADCKMSTAIALSKTLGISIDELFGAGTLDETVLQNIVTCRELPDNSKYLIRWFIKHQATLYKDDRKAGRKIISVMVAQQTYGGNLKVTNNFRQIDISSLSKELQAKVFFGLHLNCDYHMPTYSPYDVLLIANDRMPFPREHVVVIVGDNLFLVKQRFECGKIKLYGLRDGKYRCDESGVDEIVGYVAGVTLNTS